MWVAELMILDPTVAASPLMPFYGIGVPVVLGHAAPVLHVPGLENRSICPMPDECRLHLMDVEQVWTWLERAEVDLFVARPQHPLSSLVFLGKNSCRIVLPQYWKPLLRKMISPSSIATFLFWMRE